MEPKLKYKTRNFRISEALIATKNRSELQSATWYDYNYPNTIVFHT